MDRVRIPRCAKPATPSLDRARGKKGCLPRRVVRKRAAARGTGTTLVHTAWLRSAVYGRQPEHISYDLVVVVSRSPLGPPMSPGVTDLAVRPYSKNDRRLE